MGPWIEQLSDVLAKDRLVTDPDIVAGYRNDQAGFVETGVPGAVVLPRTVADVQETLRVAQQHRVPVVPRGAGSGLSGGASATHDCIVLCLQRMDKIIEVDPDNLFAVVEPGVVNGALKSSVAVHGLWYPPDPASFEFSTIGGNVATNAGGLCCVKYGVTREAVLGLEVVLADGRLVRTGRRTVKGVAGYDLTSLFIGSEGTLGIVTQVTVRLRPAPPAPRTLIAFFADLPAAGDAISRTVRDVSPSLLELLDRTTLEAIDGWKRMGLSETGSVLLLAQSDLGGDRAEADLTRIAEHCTEAGAIYLAQTDDPDEGEQLMQARRLAFPALERLGTTVLDDVAVPTGNIAALLHAIEKTAARHGIVVGTFGHAGDGNLHPTLVYDGSDAWQRDAARRVFQEIVMSALELGGTVTGEHGVGLLKRDLLHQELGADSMAVHRTIKQALDPNGILNPGKVIAPT